MFQAHRHHAAACRTPGRRSGWIAAWQRAALPSIAAVWAVGLTGCGAKRTISVTSEPSGAIVWLNDEEVGRTPVQVPFLFFGTYDVVLEKDGYATLWEKARAKAPVREYPGPDLIAELLGSETNIAWHFDLEPLDVEQPGLADGLVKRAYEMRESLRYGVEVPPLEE